MKNHSYLLADHLTRLVKMMFGSKCFHLKLSEVMRWVGGLCEWIHTARTLTKAGRMLFLSFLLLSQCYYECHYEYMYFSVYVCL